MNQTKLICLFIFAVLVSAQISKFDYSQHGDDWPSQGSGWSECSSKKQQSPIELSYQFQSDNSSYLFTKFAPVSAKISFLNTTVYIKASSSFGELYSKAVDNQLFALIATQVRIRCHAEHKIAGQDYYDLQLQVFFVSMYDSYKNTRVGLSLFFQVGDKEDQLLAKIQSAYTSQGDTVSVKGFDLSPLLSNVNQFNFWSYQGSGTIPPCKSGKLYWIISDKVNSMSQAQKNFFYQFFYKTDIIDGNWRNLQPIVDNPVKFYRY